MKLEKRIELCDSMTPLESEIASYILNNKDDLFMFGVNNTLNIIFNVGITFVLCFGISYLFSMILDKVILKKRKEKN